MTANWLRGLFPPIATPFGPDGQLGRPVLPFLEHLRDAGIDGVVALGSNGEASQLTDEERLRWIRDMREALPAPLKLIAGTGAESTQATIERTRAAAAAGAEAVLVVAPVYYRRHMSEETLRRHYSAVADASPVPVLIYNIPVHMGYDLGDWIPGLVEHPNIAGIKESSGDIQRLRGLRKRLGEAFVLLSGAGERMVETIEAGADGAIAALTNLAPLASVEIRRAMAAGKRDQAARAQAAITPLGDALTREYGLRGLKAGLRLQGFEHGDPRPPVPPLTDNELLALRGLLAEAGLLPQTVAR